MGESTTSRAGSYRELFSALLRPLEFAENSAPDQADRILNLDTQVASVSRSLSRLSIPPDMRALFESVATAFSSPSAGQVRLDRVREALALLESVRQSKVPDQVLAQLPRQTTLVLALVVGFGFHDCKNRLDISSLADTAFKE